MSKDELRIGGVKIDKIYLNADKVKSMKTQNKTLVIEFYLVIFDPNSVEHVSVGLNVIVFNEYNRLNISSAIALSRLLNTVNLHSSTAGNRRKISSMQSLLRSVNLVFECLVTRVERFTCSLTLRR